jgi:hypothetical protein
LAAHLRSNQASSTRVSYQGCPSRRWIACHRWCAPSAQIRW